MGRDFLLLFEADVAHIRQWISKYSMIFEKYVHEHCIIPFFASPLPKPRICSTMNLCFN